MRATRLIVGLSVAGLGCSSEGITPTDTTVANTLYVAHDGSLVSYDLETGKELPGTVQDVATPVDVQVLENQMLLVNLTDRNEVLAVDGKTMLEAARIPSSGIGATRPVHSYLAPERGGKRLWVALNDGNEGQLETNSATFIDVVPDSPTYLKAVGEVGLGVGHHKAAFSTTLDRVVVSNIGDCDNALSVYDYSQIGDIKTLATLSAADLGFDGSSYETTCDPTYMSGQPPAPHGCTTSAASGKAYCNVTATGQIVVIDLDADPPTFTILTTKGAGGGYTKPLYGGGQYVYSLQEQPREGSMDRPGADCQIGQLVVIDPSKDSVLKEVPLFYKGPDCKQKLVGTDEETVNPGHIQITHDKKTMIVTLGGGFGVDTARSRQVILMDIADPANPVQLPSLPVGASKSHAGDFCAGDGKTYGVVGNVDNNVTLIDGQTRTLIRSVSTKNRPLTLGSFSSTDGPSHQTGPIE